MSIKMKRNLYKITKLVFASLIFSTLAACHSTPPEYPAYGKVTWAIYTNSNIGCSLQYPDVFAINEDEDKQGVIFRYQDSPVLLVRYTDEEDGKQQGLWFGHEPEGEIRLAGKTGLKYIYRHYDGPVYGRTLSYVIKYGDKYLGVEFRTENKIPNKVQQHIIDSFKIKQIKKDG